MVIYLEGVPLCFLPGGVKAIQDEYPLNKALFHGSIESTTFERALVRCLHRLVRVLLQRRLPALPFFTD
jgi:hypothetical protein